MYLFNNHEQGLVGQSLPPLGGAAPFVRRKKRTLLEILTGEEQPRSIGSLLLILVLLLHIRAGQWLLQPQEPVTLAQPLMMEVSLVSVPGQQASTAPPAPPKPVEPPKPKKTPVKKPLKKKTPVKHKPAKPPKTEAIAEEIPLTPSELSAAESSTLKDSSPASSASSSASKTQSNAEPYTEASVNANYGFNPPPKYPAIAKRRGWQGTVRLRVSVSAEGYSEAVAIHSSSGYEELDESAIEAVRKWRFIAAKRGDTAIASSVIVPIVFKLDH
ncbi:energy transducer TonB [Methylobacter sp.]|uniref:energy transducer TonB n=1 Tax=Methylobacter sp. TaxID=2051955 RepID=UPI003DA53D02